MHPELAITGSGVLHRNPHPGHTAECAFLPSLVPLDGRSVAAFSRSGQAFYSLDGVIQIQHSGDGGDTWSAPRAVLADRRYSYTAPHGSRLADGSLLLVANRYPSTEDQLFRFNPETGGLRPYEITWCRSTDGGHSWSEEHVVPVAVEQGVPTTPTAILELADGTWFLPVEVWKSWEDTNPLRIRTFAVCSSDRGATWNERIEFPAFPGLMYSHGRYTRMSDGGIGATVWTQTEGDMRDLDLHLIRSDTSGRVWGALSPTGLQAQTSWMADLGGDLLAVVHTVRTGRVPGIYLTAGTDQGRSWNREGELLLWDAVGQEFLGVDHKPSYPASHNNIAFGKPNLVRLSEDELLCSWWCTQACVTHTRWARVRVTR